MRWILAISVAIAMLVPAKRALHMFQQNRYECGRFTKWLKEDIPTIGIRVFPFLVAAIGIVLALLLEGTIVELLLTVLSLVIFFYYYSDEKTKNYIKPLVYTARVKRQIVVMAILGILILLSFTLNVNRVTTALLMVSTVFLPWVLIYPMAWITAPIEAGVRQRYINEAKKILNDHKGLIKIGITGSYGKTTTKNIIQAVISEQYNSLMTPASFNTPMGITRTIREMLKPIHQVFVCEMGADHVGDITELMEFVRPSIGVVTSIGPQHLQTFGSQENIIHEKMQEIELLPEDGFGILNYDNAFIREYQVKNPVQTVTYAIHNPAADCRAEDITYTPKGSSFSVIYRGEKIRLETKLLGELNILNILSAVCVARYLHVEWNVIQRALKNMKQVEHRLELKRINGYRFIDDAFNANPSGASMALDVLSMMPGKRVIVTPGMIDLGEKQDEINRRFGEQMKGKADVVILVGEIQTKPIYEGLEKSGFDMNQVLVVSKVTEAFTFVYGNCTPEDTILLENDLPDAFNH